MKYEPYDEDYNDCDVLALAVVFLVCALVGIITH